MANVFISYARSDIDRVRPLADALAAHGLTVWWDQQMQSGDEFSAAIERELNAADAVIVCWSDAGVKSRWVRDEATIAARLGKMKAVSLDGVEPPIGYMQYHALNLSGWNGAPNAGAISTLIKSCGGDLAALAGTDSASVPNGKNLKAREEVTLVILPFATISTDPSDQVLSVAIHEDLTTQLARVRGYFVISRTTAAVCAEKRLSATEIGAELNVAYVLEGSMRRAGEHVRVTAQLIDAKSGGHIAALRFDRPYTELLDLQNDLIAQIVNCLGSEINLAEVRRLEARAGVDPTAMDYLKKAQSLVAQKGWNRDGLKEILAYLEKAIERDPEFAPAISQLALVKGMASQLGVLDGDPARIRDEVVALADRAVALEGGASDVLGFAGCACCDVGDVSRGYGLLESAFEIDPSNAQALAAYGWANLMLGHYDDAVRHSEAAIRISPQQPGIALWLYGLSQSYVMKGDLAAARKNLRRCMRADPKFLPSYGLLAAIETESGDTAAAAQTLAQARSADSDIDEEMLRTLEADQIKRHLEATGLLDGIRKAIAGGAAAV